MSWVADTHNNPFIVDDETLPPQRSAFAALLTERDDLLEHSVEELLDRARQRLQRDPELATVYGRTISDDELARASARLTNPKDRLINELLDYRFHRFDLKSIPELAKATEAFQKALAQWQWPELADLSLIASILLQDTTPIEPKSLERQAPPRPDLPSIKDVMDRLT